jgi:DNA polymerase III delta prime subunit
MTFKSSIPWAEKYRPTVFDDIVMDEINHSILKNIITSNTFPNLLFYGPPGTGKTTTIINLINTYQQTYDEVNKGLTIHLNASDERGIDIVRNQISQFVNTQALFSKGLKIVVLDEVDYMTKNAQQALKYLIQEANTNVRFCLICNYISKIDESLQNELIHLRFNCLPVVKIVSFLNDINITENIGAAIETIYDIQTLFKSDIRSMINYMQSNQHNIDTRKILGSALWECIVKQLVENKKLADKKFNEIEQEYQMDTQNIIKNIVNYIISEKPHYMREGFLTFCECILHLQDANDEYVKKYFIEHVGSLISYNM